MKHGSELKNIFRFEVFELKANGSGSKQINI